MLVCSDDTMIVEIAVSLSFASKAVSLPELQLYKTRDTEEEVLAYKCRKQFSSARQ